MFPLFGNIVTSANYFTSRHANYKVVETLVCASETYVSHADQVARAGLGYYRFQLGHTARCFLLRHASCHSQSAFLNFGGSETVTGRMGAGVSHCCASFEEPSSGAEDGFFGNFVTSDN